MRDHPRVRPPGAAVDFMCFVVYARNRDWERTSVDSMSLKIRLARGGAKKRPFYSIVVTDSRSPRDGRFIEKIGTYNPMVATDHPQRIQIHAERAKHWLTVGAKPTDRVALFLGRAELMPMRPYRQTPKKSAPKAKAQERLRLEEEARKAAEAG